MWVHYNFNAYEMFRPLIAILGLHGLNKGLRILRNAFVRPNITVASTPTPTPTPILKQALP